MVAPLTISGMDPYTAPKFTGQEVLPMVTTGDPATAENVGLTSAQLMAFLSGVSSPTILADAAAYASVATNLTILVDNTGALTTTITLLAAADYSAPILIKDIGGFASGPNPISLVFTGGELCDGAAQVDIDAAYGWVVLVPLTDVTPNRFYIGGAS